MPHRFNGDRRDQIPKQKHQMSSWIEYNEGLRRRRDLTVRISEDAPALWSAPRRITRGRQPRHSDLAVEIAVPDCSTRSRRGKGLT